jgi:transposase
MLLTEGQMSDHKGAKLMLDPLPDAKALLGDRGYDSNWFRAALAEKGIEACIPSSRSRKVEIPHDKTLYRQRHRIENRQWDKVRRSLDALEKHPDCGSVAQVHAGHFALRAMLGYLDVRFHGEWEAGRPRLVAWKDAFDRSYPQAEDVLPQ